MVPHLKVSSEKLKKTKKPEGIITAVVLTHSDFSQLLNIQNLLNYFIECLTLIFSGIEISESNLKNIKLCIEHINRLKLYEIEGIDEELKKMMENFICKLNYFSETLKNSNNDDIKENISISGKTAELQWHALCLKEEIKKYIFNSNIID